MFISARRLNACRHVMAVAFAAGLATLAALPAAQAQSYGGPPVTDTAGAAPAPAPGSRRWPMRIDTANGQITIYQPQAASLDGDKLTGRAAVSVLRPGQTDPIFGAIWMESRISTDRVARTVQVLDITVTKAHFPDANGATEQELTAALKSVLAQQPMTISLDHLLTTLQVSQQERQATKDLATTPPAIVFRDHPAVLLQYDGAPRLAQVPNAPLMRAVNTPFFVVLDTQTKSYYLKGGGKWFVSTTPLGPFQSGPPVPADVAAASQAGGYQDPQQPMTDAQAAAVEVVTATNPTELIWTDGPEEMGTIGGTDLLYVANTDSDVFMTIDTQQLFVLLSGRWYTAPNTNGPWAYVAPDQLPADFQRIPPSSPKGSVLASVANTQQAKDAIADSYVPQTAAIDPQNYQQPAVTYDGGPDFQPIENTQMSYAVNTPSSVLLVGGQYYCCSDAVWYVGAQAVGPWAVCTSVPQVIYTIPPTCPIYPVRFCYVYEATPNAIYVGYLPGYLGCFRNHGVVVFGTGYHYAAWWGANSHAYFARPFTFGFGAHYDAYTSHWGFGLSARIGGEADGFRGWISSGSGPVAHVGGWFGHGGYRPVVRYDATHHPDLAAHRTEINVYARRTDVRRDLAPARMEGRGPVVPGGRPGPAPRVDVQAMRPGTAVLTDSRNNVYADSKGDVYRKTINGWDQRQGNKWVPTAIPARSPGVAPGGAHTVAPVAEHHEAAPAAEHHEAAPAAERHEGAPAAHAAPSELNNEYRARVSGEQRSASFGGASAPAPSRSTESRGGGESHASPAPAPAPRNNGGSSGGGNSSGGNSAGGGTGRKN